MQKKTVWIAGWLFADLLLGLAMLFIVSMAGMPAPTPVPPWTATFSPTPTRTGTPTAVPTSRVSPGVPVTTPTPAIGLNPLPYMVTLRVDPEMFFSINRQVAEERLREQINVCFESSRKSRVGLILATGYTAEAPNKGHELALGVQPLLFKQFPDTFQRMVFKHYHNFSPDDPIPNGIVELEVYYIDEPGTQPPKKPDGTSLLGTTCEVPKAWCEGREEAQKLLIVNWVSPPSSYLNLTIDGRRLGVKSAKGIYRTVGCTFISPGPHSWSSGSGGGRFDIKPGEDGRLDLCFEKAQVVECQISIAPDATDRGRWTPTPMR